jgi:hypothetical protein
LSLCLLSWPLAEQWQEPAPVFTPESRPAIHGKDAATSHVLQHSLHMHQRDLPITSLLLTSFLIASISGYPAGRHRTKDVPAKVIFSEQAEVTEDLRRQVYPDKLTGLANRCVVTTDFTTQAIPPDWVLAFGYLCFSHSENGVSAANRASTWYSHRDPILLSASLHRRDYLVAEKVSCLCIHPSQLDSSGRIDYPHFAGGKDQSEYSTG